MNGQTMDKSSKLEMITEARKEDGARRPSRRREKVQGHSLTYSVSCSAHSLKAIGSIFYVFCFVLDTAGRVNVSKSH